MALIKEVEDYVIGEYANHLLDIQIKEKYQEMWAEVNTIMAISNDVARWEKRRLKKLEYKEIINEIEGQKS